MGMKRGCGCVASSNLQTQFDAQKAFFLTLRVVEVNDPFAGVNVHLLDARDGVHSQPL